MTSRGRTSFKRMFLVDEKLYNKLNNLPVSNNNNKSTINESPPPPLITTSAPTLTNLEMNRDHEDEDEDDSSNMLADQNNPTISSDATAHENDIMVGPITSNTTDETDNTYNQDPMLDKDGNSYANLSSYTPNMQQQKLTISNPMAKAKIVDLKKRPVSKKDINILPQQMQQQQNLSHQEHNRIPFDDEDNDDNVISQSETCKSNCKLCGKEFSTESVVRAHYKQFHPMKPASSNSNNNSDPSSEAVAKEITRNECKVCNIYFPSTAALNKHIQDMHEKNQSNIALENTDDDDDDLENLGLDDDDDSNSDKESEEEKEDMIDSSPQNKTVKRKRSNSEDGDDNDNNNKKYRKSFKCKICQSTYKTENALNRHNNNIHNYLVDDTSDQTPGRRRSKRKIDSIEGGGNDELEDIILRKQKKI